jgi:hypothetical protein
VGAGSLNVRVTMYGWAVAGAATAKMMSVRDDALNEQGTCLFNVLTPLEVK